MGGSQSTRRVTLENPDSYDGVNVIKVSDRVVQRLQNTRMGGESQSQSESEESRSDEQKSRNPPPNITETVLPTPKFNSLRDEVRAYGFPYLTTTDVHEYVRSELERNEREWRDRVRLLEQSQAVMTRTLLEENVKAQKEMEKILPKPLPENAQPPCKSLSDQVAACFTSHPKESLKCATEVRAFQTCILDSSRSHSSVA